MKRGIIILSALVLAFTFSITGFAKDNDNGGAINYNGNVNVDDSQFTKKNNDNGGAINYNGNGNVDGGAIYIP